ncbi:hypothetical protein N0A02_18425 [Paraburkholderia acidicola]|uniref:Uncharacterized protein n=1 Tax=Paraburkholderia acidicola TaxID=1912599 RepID=A0ABV1LQ54_9BURK
MVEAILSWYHRFRAPPFLVQRVLLCVLFVCSLIVGVKIAPWSTDMAGVFLLIAWVGLVWATGFWYVLRVAWFIARLVIRMNF